MANPVYVCGLALGEGRPKICVPLVSADADALRRELAAALAAGAEVVEWRADCMVGLLHPRPVEEMAETLAKTAEGLRGGLGEIPLLFTLRSQAEGGQCPLGPAETARLLQAAAEGGAVDLLDIELSLGEAHCRALVAAARARGVITVLSHHRFDATPPEGDMLATLRQAEALGGDIAKLAVMPGEPADVLALLGATEAFHCTGSVPAITMSMGALGAVSRVCGEVFGSCLTFGAGQSASAPGQIPAGTLAGLLEALRLSKD